MQTRLQSHVAPFNEIAIKLRILTQPKLALTRCAGENNMRGRFNLGPSYYLLVMSVTPKVALVTLGKRPFAEGLLVHQARVMMPRIINCLAHPSRKDQ